MKPDACDLYDYYISRVFYPVYNEDFPFSHLFEIKVSEAFRILEKHTTGIDGVKKLKIAFPVDEDDANTVKHCWCKIIEILYQLRDAENAAAEGRGYTKTDHGLQRKIVSRVESGNEAISYSETKLSDSLIDAAASDLSAQKALMSHVIREYLSGVCDANGVNLLYMGEYPRRFL